MKTKYLFHPEGTIQFRYKPFNINYDGFSDFENVLFDSEYVKIETRITTGFPYATYHAVVYNSSGSNIEIDTDMSVCFELNALCF